jgi:diguanylate cyclase (GGDEF)-like protein
MPYQQKKIFFDKNIVYLLFLFFFLPFVIVGIFTWQLAGKGAFNAAFFSWTNKILLGALGVSFLYGIFLIYRMLKGIRNISEKTQQILPPHKRSELSVLQLKKPHNGMDTICWILDELEFISRYVRELHLEKNVAEENGITTKLEAIHDSLCNIFNRKHMEELLNEKCSSGESFAVALCDIDFFKNVNDTYGHACGDFVLKEMSARIFSSLRDDDTLGRWGGEEFAITLDDVDIEKGEMVFERIRQTIEGTPFLYIDPQGAQKKMTVTISIGFTLCEGGAYALHDVIKKADEALYKAKQAGRNKVVFSPLNTGI